MTAEELRIETGAELKAARLELELSLAELADRLRLRGGHKAQDHLREIEEGRRELTGPIAVAVELLLEQKRDDDFHERLREL